MCTMQELALNIREFAALCGVSSAAASRILNYSQKDSRASLQTYSRVRQMAAELGFRPNYAAKSLHTNKSNCIGVIVGYPNPVNSMPLLKGISECAYAHGISLSITTCGNNPRKEMRAFEEMLYRGVDAIIWHPIFHRMSGGQTLLEKKLHQYAPKLPIVSTGYNLVPGIFKLTSKRKEDANYAAQRQLALGCKKFAVISSIFSYYSIEESRAFYKDALLQAGVPQENIVEIVLHDKKNPPNWSSMADVDGVWMYYLFMLHPLLTQMQEHCNLNTLHVDGQSFVEDYALTKWIYAHKGDGQQFSENFASLEYHLVDATHSARRATEIAIEAMRNPDLAPYEEYVPILLRPHNIKPREILFEW